MTTQTTPEQAREIAQHLFFPGGEVGFALQSLADQVESLTAERDALKDAARLALDALSAMISIVVIHQKATKNKFALPELEYADEAIAALKAVL